MINPQFVTSNLIRGARPKSFRDIKMFDERVSTVVNLQSGIYEQFTFTPYEMQTASEFGMREVNIECSDICPPTYDQVKHFINLVASHDNLLKLVYVHCLQGKDRTGFMCACWRIYCGMSVESAIQEMYRNGFHKWPYFYWVPTLKKYAWKIQSREGFTK